MNGENLRSILPHEPTPAEGPAFLQLQGALTPRKKSLESDEVWTKQSLQIKLEAIFCCSSDLIPKSENLAIQVRLLDQSPPFTKFRLLYESADQALHLLHRWKSHSLSPADIFGASHTTRKFQITPLTTSPLPPNSWSRSTPPTFRRLNAPQRYETEEWLDEQRAQTRFLYVEHLFAVKPEIHSNRGARTQKASNLKEGLCSSAVIQAIRSALNAYDTSGDGIEVFWNSRNPDQCHVGFRSSRDAHLALVALQGSVVHWDEIGTSSGRLFVDYADMVQSSQAIAAARAVGPAEKERGEPCRPECTSLTQHIEIPGLVVVPDFVSASEEATLVAVLQGPHAPWAPAQATPTEGRTVRRRVQHFGYIFDYQTADVLRDRRPATAQCPPMPALPPNGEDIEKSLTQYLEQGLGWHVLAGVIERTRRATIECGAEMSFPHLNQLTVNVYGPGEGIGSHVDTVSAFADGLMSISLNSGIVMEFRSNGVRKQVYLPQRSLLVMSGPARYDWEHMIVTRQTDTHEGRVIPRETRISLTLRTALDESGAILPRVESSDFPPVWGGLGKATESLATPECEKVHVHDVYDAIAKQWHHTRGRRGVLWPGATTFLQRLPPCSIVADVGCGDGKYFPAIWEAGSYVIGTDISLPLLRTALMRDDEGSITENRKVSKTREHLRARPSVVVGDCMSIPLRTDSCDAAICIAVLHHVSTFQRRRRCIEELARTVKPGGLINVQAWSLEQEEGSRHKFAANDVFVPFNVQPKYLSLSNGADTDESPGTGLDQKSTAQRYSEAFRAQYDDSKGLVVFQRYCHLYREGELEAICAEVPNVSIMERGYESGNHFVILRVKSS